MATLATPLVFMRNGVLGSAGEILSAGVVSFWVAGSSFTQTKVAYVDADKSASITELTLDADGRGTAYGDGFYDIRVKDSEGATIFEILDVALGVDDGAAGALGATVFESLTQPIVTLRREGAIQVLFSVDALGRLLIDASGDAIITTDDFTAADLTATGDLDVTGVSDLRDDVHAYGAVQVDGDLDVDGSANLNAGAVVTGLTQTEGLTVTSTTTLQGTVSVPGDITFTGAVDLSGATQTSTKPTFYPLSGSAYLNGCNAADDAGFIIDGNQIRMIGRLVLTAADNAYYTKILKNLPAIVTPANTKNIVGGFTFAADSTKRDGRCIVVQNNGDVYIRSGGFEASLAVGDAIWFDGGATYLKEPATDASIYTQGSF